MNYAKIYRSLCERGQQRSKSEGYYERHHIIPIFFYKNSTRKHRYNDGIYEGDGNHIANITLLTPREHFVAHLLLCKIWSNTKWYHRCRSSLLLFFNSNAISQHPRLVKGNFNPGASRKYDIYRRESISSISELRRGTMPVKDSKTGVMIGSVSVDHPNVLSGVWVHHSRGKSASAATKLKMSMSMKGFGNGYSKYTDAEIVASYLECCRKCGIIVNNRFWVKYAKAHGIPYLTNFKPFRLNGGGFNDLLKLAADAGIPHIKPGPNPFHSKEYRHFIRNFTWD
jgi:hypothetical protein